MIRSGGNTDGNGNFIWESNTVATGVSFFTTDSGNAGYLLQLRPEACPDPDDVRAADGNVLVTNDYANFNIDLCTSSTTTVTWTAVDDCGNETEVTANLIIEGDEVPPVFSFTPAPLTVDCNSGDITLGNG